MFTDYTYQDWEKENLSLMELLPIIRLYRTSEDFAAALRGLKYFSTDNTAIASKTVLSAGRLTKRTADGRQEKNILLQDVAGNRICSGFFRRFVLQQAQYLLGNGVTLEKREQKRVLGAGFDTILSEIGTYALVEGVCYGYWNVDHLECIRAVADPLSGFAPLLDEMTGEVRAGIQFWQMSPDRPLLLRLFEVDGVTDLTGDVRTGQVRLRAPKRPYRLQILRDSTGEKTLGGTNYDALPILPFYANVEKVSELTPAILTKIDLYDRILSDFGDNLDRANDIYWVLNNFGGTTEDIGEMLEEIHRLKAIANLSDGTTSSTVEPHTFEVPYRARQEALNILEKQLCKDYLALATESLTGGSLTNVAIKAAITDLDMKSNAFEWQAFRFVQSLLGLLGMKTESITFKRRSLTNDTETIEGIYKMRGDLTRRKALQLNPYISEEEIETILTEKRQEAEGDRSEGQSRDSSIR